MTTRPPTHRYRATTGVRRVALYCVDELRPAACCVVDALAARGFDVSLETGAAARAALHAAASPKLLRVVWAPDADDLPTRTRLRSLLVADTAGDVMVLASVTPRGVIDAIDAFRVPRARDRKRSPRRTYLAQPTSVERTLEPRRWFGSAIAAAAIVAAVAIGLVADDRSRAADPPSHTIADAPVPSRAESCRDDDVLAATRAPRDTPDEEEPVIVLDPPVATSPRAVVASEGDAWLPSEPAPLDDDAPAAAPVVPLPPLANAGGPPRISPAGARTIDPF